MIARFRESVVVGLGILLLAAGAHAAPAEANPFQDWISTSNYMKSKGVDPLIVEWRLIEPMCLGLSNQKDQTAYNKCKYEKAHNNVLHRSDRAQCFVQAKATYPDRLTHSHTETLRETDRHGVEHTFEREVKALSEEELNSLRYSATVGCMQNLGWANADDWTLGHRCGD